ncbi:TIGR03936 family radical SAM-associated protein [Natronospora cellulosivora (SeqCode)]
MLIRAKFEKLEGVRYISHLELMDSFRRAFRRAELPLAYSKGFNPHIILSLGNPLKVGMLGRGEYFDLELAENITPDNFINKVNEKLPSDIKILEAKQINNTSKSLMALIDTAVYDYNMKYKVENFEEEQVLQSFLAEEKIEVLRKRKRKKDRLIDIRPLILDADILAPGKWRFKVQSGSSGNLRAEELIRSLNDFCDDIYKVPIINIEREGLYIQEGGNFYTPLDDKYIGS